MAQTKLVKKGFASIELLVVLVLIGIVAFGAYYFGTQSTKSSEENTVKSTPSAEKKSETEFDSTFTFSNKDQLEVTTKNDTKIVYRDSDYFWLEVNSQLTLDVDSLMKCEDTEYGLAEKGEYCLAEGIGWGQSSDVVSSYVDGVPARSFYISGDGPDSAFRVVQTTEDPEIELIFYVSGAMLDQNFEENILPSFKFIER